jgi:DNA-binding HxlR family transcriptional regulator
MEPSRRNTARPGRAKRASPRLVPANSVARALAAIGDRWSLLILGSAFQGMHRFDQWRHGIGIASNILAARLNRLVELGCLTRSTGNEGRHPTYRLTRMGAELYPTALMFWRFDHLWSQRHPLQANTLVHASCGHAMQPALVCGHCHEPVKPRDVRYAEGPGAGMESMPPPKTTRRSLMTLDAGSKGNTLFGDSIDHFGDRWSQLVLAAFFLGAHRYDEIRGQWHIATNILADRLKVLVDKGLLGKRLYQQRPDRYEYVLTPKGMDVYPILLTLTRWGDRWLASRSGPPLLLTHTACGQPLVPLVVCDHCSEELAAHRVSFKPK